MAPAAQPDSLMSERQIYAQYATLGIFNTGKERGVQRGKSQQEKNTIYLGLSISSALDLLN